VAGVAHHVTQRGNRHEDVFFADADRRRYLRLLSDYAGRRGLDLLAYCLMTNHVHLVVVPASASTLSLVLKPVHLRYAQHVNRTQGISGRLWQGRFFSCPLDARHTLAAIRYVEQNPVRARLVEHAEEYAWSSAAAHCGLREDLLLSDIAALREDAGITDWSGWLRGDEEGGAIEHLRLRTRTGRPLGSEAFIDRVEAETRRTLRPRRAGRPRKQT
jgi:putative transposase